MRLALGVWDAGNPGNCQDGGLIPQDFLSKNLELAAANLVGSVKQRAQSHQLG